MAEKGQYPAGDSTSINGTPADTGGLVELNTAGYLRRGTCATNCWNQICLYCLMVRFKLRGILQMMM